MIKYLMRPSTIILLVTLLALTTAEHHLLTAKDILAFTPNPNDVVKSVRFDPLKWAEP